VRPPLILELGISPGVDGGYLVSARSDAGDTGVIPTRFDPIDSGTLESQLRQVELALLRSVRRTRRLITEDERPILDLGREMFEFLFRGQAREHLAAMRNQAALQGTQLQVRLRIRPPELAALPWELLYDQDRDDYLCLCGSLIRHLEVLEPHRPLEVSGPLRILGMISNPTGLNELDGNKERELLQQSLAPLIAEGVVQLSWVPGQTWRDLRSAVQQESWHMFHFIGHGEFSHADGEGVLVLADEHGKPYRLAAGDLGRVLVGGHRSLRLVVLNSCQTAEASSGDVFSSTAAVLTRRGIPAVVAMQYEITDQAAIAFARGLYEAVASRLPVDQAVTSARLDMKLDRSSLEWAIPALYLRSSSGVLFAPRTEVPHPPGSPASREPRTQAGVPSGPLPQGHPTTSAGPSDRIMQLPYANRTPTWTLLTEIGHTSAVRAAAFSPDGVWVATGSDGAARLLDATTGRQVAEMEHRLRWIWAVAFNPDAGLLATGSGDKTAGLWHIPTGENRARLHHDGLVGAVAFSPDGDLLATASDDGTSRLWEVRSGHELARLEHDGAVHALAFSADGAVLATAGDDRVARLWEMPGGKLVARLEHDGAVHALAFSADGAVLATAGDDRVARLWEMPGGKLVARLQHRGVVWVLGFSPDSSRLITGSDDQSARLWAT
jgi:CHAT domain/WD domain, G-beta repeat